MPPPPPPPLTRDQWLKKFNKIVVQGLIMATPGVEADVADAAMTLVRIGSFWFRDEECHVYVMEQAMLAMIQNRDQITDRDFAVVTPLWAFYRSGNAAKIVGNPEAMAIASRNFMKFFDEAYKRYKANG
jgi:hypothetical protein